MIHTSVHEANEQWLRLALEATRLTAWEWDLATGTVTYSSSEITCFRLQPGHMTCTIAAFKASLYPPDIPVYEQAVAAAITHGDPYHVQVRTHATDGQLRWLDVRGIVQQNEAGQPEKMIGITRDMSAEKQRERMQSVDLAISPELDGAASKDTRATIPESQQILAGLIENTGSSIWAVNAAYCLIMSNTLFQREVSAAIGREVKPGEHLVELPLPRELLDTWRALYDRALAGESFCIELPVRSTAGSRTVAYRFSPIRTATEEITGVIVSGQDITGRLHAEAQLHETERKLSTLVELLPVGISILDAEHRLVYANPALTQILQLETTGLFTGAYHARQYLRADRSPMPAEEFASTQALRQQHAVANIETGIVTETGETIWTSVSAAPVDFPDWRVVVATVDITERKQTEELLQTSRTKLAAALESMTDAVFISDRAGNFIDFNEAFATFHKFRNKEECAKTLAEYPAFLDVFMASGELAPLEQWAVPRALRGETVTNAEYSLRRRDTGEAWVGSYSFAPIRDPDGTIVGSVVVGRDITERKHAEKALQVSEERLRLAQQVAHIGVFDLDLQTGINIWTPELEALYGLQPGEFGGTYADWEKLVHPEDLAEGQRLVQQAIETMLPTDGVWRVVWPDRSIHWLAGRFQVLADAKGVPRRCTGVNIDITAQKLEEERQRQLESRFQQMQKLESLGVLAGGIAHDFNNMLTSILGYADLALLELSTSSSARYLLSKAVDGARQAAELTNQLLAYSGKGRFVVEPINLSLLIEDITRLLEISISKKCVLKYNLLLELPSIAADATQIRQVIMNLVINASEAIGDNSGLIMLTTSVMHCDRTYLSETYLDEDLPDGLYVYLEVADNGSGMSAETRVRIFEPFFTTKFTGRGLGLAAVLGIVRGHHGAIKVYSEPGKGTTFKLIFPVTDLPASPAESSIDSTTEWYGSGTVLVIDDEEAVRDLAQRMLERMGFNVLTAADGREGVELMRRHAEQISLVVLDMTMPYMDGEEAFRELRRIRGDVRAILSSGYNEQTATSRFVGKKLAAFIQKPYRFEDLRTVVRKVIENDTAGNSREV